MRISLIVLLFGSRPKQKATVSKELLVLLCSQSAVLRSRLGKAKCLAASFLVLQLQLAPLAAEFRF